MTKYETYQLLQQIAMYYHKFNFNQQTIDDWYKKLSPIAFDSHQETLRSFVKKSQFPPTVKDFILLAPKGTIPTTVETKYIVYTNWIPAKDEVVQHYLTQIREKIGLER
jgi:hypothetical protein